jgi:hypothetical protein
MAKHLRLVRATDRQPIRKPAKDWLTHDRRRQIVIDRGHSPDDVERVMREIFFSLGQLQPYQTWIQTENLQIERKEFLDRLDYLFPKVQVKSAPSRRLTEKEIRDLVAEYRTTTPNPSARGLAEFAKGHKVVGHRTELRAELKSKIGRQGAGRPRK